ncbi:MAG: cytochrome C biogenesis protein [Betaproteobacteria bacterium]|nr:MAG: cytochrome C biogenesis protein [Betaproteobacteria bacterium]
MPEIVIHGVVSAAYAGLAWHFWNTRWRAPRAETLAGLAGWERSALFATLALHGWLLAQEVFLAPQLRFGFAQALAVTLWLGVVIYWVESLFLRLDGFEPLILPLAALAAPLPALFPGIASPALAASLEFKLHMLLAMCAYSLFTIAILHAMLMTLVERRLHRAAEPGRERRAPLEGALAHLPPLLTLERLLFRLIASAFAFLTLTLASGIAFSETLFGRALPFNHKTLFALLSWATFAALLIGRYFYGWRGRTALRWTLTGFVMLLFAYVGSRFVLEVILGRG